VTLRGLVWFLRRVALTHSPLHLIVPAAFAVQGEPIAAVVFVLAAILMYAAGRGTRGIVFAALALPGHPLAVGPTRHPPGLHRGRDRGAPPDRSARAIHADEGGLDWSVSAVVAGVCWAGGVLFAFRACVRRLNEDDS
jgi:hypothetical protein